MGKIWDFFSDIITSVKETKKNIITSVKETKKKYKKRCDNMSAEEKEKETEKRMDAYKALCLGGLTSMYWKDTTALLIKVQAINGSFSVVLSELFAVYQAGMLIGLAAASFHKSSPWSVGVASNGSLFAVLFNIAAFHLEIVEFVSHIGLLISWIVLYVAFSVYWCVSSQDLTLVNLLFKFLCLIWSCVKSIFWYLIYLALSYFIYYLRIGAEYMPDLGFGGIVGVTEVTAARRAREEAAARRAREEAAARRSEALRNRHIGDDNV